jgi:hypothetical protein
VKLVLSLVLALGIVGITGIRLLSLIPGTEEVFGDFVVTALVLSAGTESANTLQKYFGYVKDAKKAVMVDLKIIPASAQIQKSGTVRFLSVVANTPLKAVDWKVLAGPGAIDADGNYQNDGSAGTAEIAAVSLADPSVVATAKVKVT